MLISVSTTCTIVRPIVTAVIQWVHIFAQVSFRTAVNANEHGP